LIRLGRDNDDVITQVAGDVFKNTQALSMNAIIIAN
jgi:hypothetical protein